MALAFVSLSFLFIFCLNFVLHSVKPIVNPRYIAMHARTYFDFNQSKENLSRQHNQARTRFSVTFDFEIFPKIAKIQLNATPKYTTAMIISRIVGPILKQIQFKRFVT